ncbi:MAG: hypothetical protein ABIZ70_10620 [Gemmatimonadales bacterium]
MSRIQLSVIVAVAPGHPALESTLDSLAAALPGITAEVIVVGGSPVVHPSIEILRHVAAAPDMLVPEAWGVGIATAAGEIVGCLSTEFIVQQEWAKSLLPMVRDQVAGAAGAIAIAPHSSGATTGMYLLRFAPFLPGSEAPATRDNIPGDGALYRREKILEHPDLLAEGFWEIEFHRRWLAAGDSLVFDPTARITFLGPVSLAEGVALRYRHGVTYGSTMVLRHSNSRMRHILLAPILPLVLTGRIARRLKARGGSLAPLIRSLPALLALTSAWSAGEAVGAMRPNGGTAK